MLHHLLERHSGVFAVLRRRGQILRCGGTAFAELREDPVELRCCLCGRCALCCHGGEGCTDLLKGYAKSRGGGRDLCQDRAKLTDSHDAEVLGLHHDFLHTVCLFGAHAVGVQHLCGRFHSCVDVGETRLRQPCRTIQEGKSLRHILCCRNARGQGGIQSIIQLIRRKAGTV